MRTVTISLSLLLRSYHYCMYREAGSSSIDIASDGSCDITSNGSSDIACNGTNDGSSDGSSDIASDGSSDGQTSTHPGPWTTGAGPRREQSVVR